MRQHLVAVDAFGARFARTSNAGSLRAAHDWLAGGGCLLTFPAGEVAHHVTESGVALDGAWHRHVSALAVNSGRGRITGLRRGDQSPPLPRGRTAAPLAADRTVAARIARPTRIAGAPRHRRADRGDESVAPASSRSRSIFEDAHLLAGGGDRNCPTTARASSSRAQADSTSCGSCLSGVGPRAAGVGSAAHRERRSAGVLRACLRVAARAARDRPAS